MRYPKAFHIALVAVVAAIAPRLAPAQAPGFSGIAGSVIDSVHGVIPLAGATVKVGSTNRQGVTDANGRFTIDSVPPGSHSLTVLHPLLDTLNITIATREVPFVAGQSLAVEMAVPSATTVIAIHCPAAWRARGPSALVGRVLDADNDTPLVGAKVSLVWQQLSLQTLRKEPVVRSGLVAADGSYKICGLPSGIDGNVQADFNGKKTAEVRVVMEEATPLGFQSLRIGTTMAAEAPVDTTPRPAGTPVKADSGPPRLRGPARLSGKVINAAGAPIPNARVDVQGTGAATLSRQDGSFGFTDLPSGTQAVVVRQLGFEPVEVPVELSGKAPKQVTVTMSKPARVLDPVAVVASGASADVTGFDRRKKNGFGYFMSTEDIDSRQATRMTDLFRTVPSLRVVPSGMDYVVESARDVQGGCVRYVVDGSPYQSMFPGDIDRLMPPHDVGAIEVYSGSSTPAEFQAPGQSSCTTVVMWSKFKMKKDRK
ncbi:MAG TPA: carboxypeptidase regulatory-like domain-containing protein [Gemmatimonadaceae bacterium]|nr:carboxypeptidase regulatory-like domain-containing protein [Gemmatimonadaceae bacterium]